MLHKLARLWCPTLYTAKMESLSTRNTSSQQAPRFAAQVVTQGIKKRKLHVLHLEPGNTWGKYILSTLALPSQCLFHYYGSSLQVPGSSLFSKELNMWVQIQPLPLPSCVTPASDLTSLDFSFLMWKEIITTPPFLMNHCHILT